MDQVTLAKNQMRADNWRGLIQACQQSGQTVIQWCQTNNINIKTYYYQLRKLRTQALAEKALPVPVEVPENSDAYCYEIVKYFNRLLMVHGTKLLPDEPEY